MYDRGNAAHGRARDAGAPHAESARWRHGLVRAACLIAIVLGGFATSPAPASIRGVPFSRTYSLDDIGYVPRGSRLDFDSYGRIAVIHDGVYAVLNDTAWINVAQVEEAARTPMLNVVHAGYGRSYYGGRASWGLAEFGPDGCLHAKPLVPPDPPVWTRTAVFDDVLVTSDGVYFSSRNGLVFWDFAEKTCQLYELPGLSKMFAVRNKVFVSCASRPLRLIDVKERSVRMAPPTPASRAPIDRAVPLDDAHALVSFFDGRLLVFDGEKATPWADGNRAFPDGRITAMRNLVEGNIALAISGKGLFVVSPEGKLLLSLTSPQYQRVSSIASREQGVLWVLTEDSIERILYRGGLTSFGHRQGLTLFWPAVVNWQGSTFVASASVLYEAISPAPGATAQFEPLAAQPPGGARSITAAGPHLLVGSATEIFAMTPERKFTPVARLNGLAHLALVDEKHCYAIGSSAIALLEWDGNRWFEPTPRISGLAHAFGIQSSPRAVWVEMGGDGVARVCRKGDQLDLMVLRNEAWTKANFVNVSAVGDTVVLSALDEPRRFFDEATGAWCERPRLARLLDSSPRWLSRVWQDETGTLWAAHSDGLVRFTPRGEEYESDLSSFDLINDRYPIVHVLPGNDLWVTASRSLQHVEPVTTPLAQTQSEPVLVSLTDTRRNVELLARRLQREPLRLSYAQNSLTFRFFSGSYAWRRTPAYEFRLNPGEPWARIDSGSLLPFPNLSEGDYQLQVRVAGDRVAPSPATTFAFAILPPWHRTWPAYGAYTLLLLVAVVAAVWWSGHLARQRNRVLEQLVRDRTGELESTMQRLGEETRATATLAERNRLAGEIHDSVQQGLSGAILQLDTTLKLPSVAGDLLGRLKVVRNMVAYARQEVQHTVWDMDSPLLEGNDLGEALRRLSTFTISANLVPSVTVKGTPVALPRRTTHHLLRIAQEATTNAARHAAARRIDLELDYGADQVSLTIADDGVGFDLDAALEHRGHFGLSGIRGRAKTLGGKLKIHSAPGAGTSIHVLVPLPAPE